MLKKQTVDASELQSPQHCDNKNEGQAHEAGLQTRTKFACKQCPSYASTQIRAQELVPTETRPTSTCSLHASNKHCLERPPCSSHVQGQQHLHRQQATDCPSHRTMQAKDRKDNVNSSRLSGLCRRHLIHGSNESKGKPNLPRIGQRGPTRWQDLGPGLEPKWLRRFQTTDQQYT